MNYKLAVKKFIRKVKKVDFINSEKFANSLGYDVDLFNIEIDTEKLKMYGAEKYAATHKAFTLTSVHIIFISDRLSIQERLYLLLHEIAHILLGHIGDGKSYARDKILIDVEANSFVNEVLNYKRISSKQIVCTVIALLLGVTVGYFAPHKQPTLPAYRESVSETVFVTQSGNRFHKSDCRYIKDKKCTKLDRSEAVKKYAPCSVCNP